MRAEQVTAHELVGELARVRDRSRASASMMWFPLLLFGALSLLSAPVVGWFGGAALGMFWLVAGPAGGVATGVVSARRGRRVGAEVPAGPYLAVAVLILAGALVAGWAGDALGEHMISAAGPPLAISAGYLLFARIERSRALGWTAGGLAALTVALLPTGIGPEPLAAVLAVAYGAVFLATGVVLWGRRG
jgi:nitrate reductase NapE component